MVYQPSTEDAFTILEFALKKGYITKRKKRSKSTLNDVAPMGAPMDLEENSSTNSKKNKRKAEETFEYDENGAVKNPVEANFKKLAEEPAQSINDYLPPDLLAQVLVAMLEDDVAAVTKYRSLNAQSRRIVNYATARKIYIQFLQSKSIVMGIPFDKPDGTAMSQEEWKQHLRRLYGNYVILCCEEFEKAYEPLVAHAATPRSEWIKKVGTMRVKGKRKEGGALGTSGPMVEAAVNRMSDFCFGTFRRMVNWAIKKDYAEEPKEGEEGFDDWIPFGGIHSVLGFVTRDSRFDKIVKKEVINWKPTEWDAKVVDTVRSQLLELLEREDVDQGVLSAKVLDNPNIEDDADLRRLQNELGDRVYHWRSNTFADSCMELTLCHFLLLTCLAIQSEAYVRESRGLNPHPPNSDAYADARRMGYARPRFAYFYTHNLLIHYDFEMGTMLSLWNIWKSTWKYEVGAVLGGPVTACAWKWLWSVLFDPSRFWRFFEAPSVGGGQGLDRDTGYKMRSTVPICIDDWMIPTLPESPVIRHLPFEIDVLGDSHIVLRSKGSTENLFLALWTNEIVGNVRVDAKKVTVSLLAPRDRMTSGRKVPGITLGLEESMLAIQFGAQTTINAHSVTAQEVQNLLWEIMGPNDGNETVPEHHRNNKKLTLSVDPVISIPDAQSLVPFDFSEWIGGSYLRPFTQYNFMGSIYLQRRLGYRPSIEHLLGSVGKLPQQSLNISFTGSNASYLRFSLESFWKNLPFAKAPEITPIKKAGGKRVVHIRQNFGDYPISLDVETFRKQRKKNGKLPIQNCLVMFEFVNPTEQPFQFPPTDIRKNNQLQSVEDCLSLALEALRPCYEYLRSISLGGFGIDFTTLLLNSNTKYGMRYQFPALMLETAQKVAENIWQNDEYRETAQGLFYIVRSLYENSRSPADAIALFNFFKEAVVSTIYGTRYFAREDFEREATPYNILNALQLFGPVPATPLPSTNSKKRTMSTKAGVKK